MKKLSFMLVLVLSLSLIGCTTDNLDTNPDDNNVESPDGNGDEMTEDTPDPDEAPDANGDTNGDMTATYTDGSYTSMGDPWDYGSEDATVEIKDGKMTNITLRRFDLEGNEVDYDMWTGEEKDGKVYPNLKQYREDLANEMIAKQTYEVDSIAGATVSSENWKLAVKRALEEAQ
ncbi:FMN-binding protein [Vallitalea okinawensis]|uniref:FMN-binding protein n=1 Tax=Vallitalea okinawensis TaxID=2078660 RepID=UPI000CFBE7BB|nr:FMN-binding protein [Vallitalea okinawensis]